MLQIKQPKAITLYSIQITNPKRKSKAKNIVIPTRKLARTYGFEDKKETSGSSY